MILVDTNILTETLEAEGVSKSSVSALYDCPNLKGVYFEGTPPISWGFGDANPTIYYLPGTTGWATTFGGLPTALWLPQAQTNDGSFGVQTNRFGFTITWASDRVVVVEATTNLTNPNWYAVSTNVLTGGSSYFSDPQWTNYPGRFYRIRSP